MQCRAKMKNQRWWWTGLAPPVLSDDFDKNNLINEFNIE
jgi:hypothetical protein